MRATLHFPAKTGFNRRDQHDFTVPITRNVVFYNDYFEYPCTLQDGSIFECFYVCFERSRAFSGVGGHWRKAAIKLATEWIRIFHAVRQNDTTLEPSDWHSSQPFKPLF